MSTEDQSGSLIGVLGECQHERQQLRRRVVGSGAVQYVQQCQNCGKATSQPIAHARVKGSPAAFDENLELIYSKLREAAYKAKREAEKAEFDSEYGAYLRSPEWANKRRLVMKRCGGICEGCMENPATQVHHLTYDHVGNELLFELVGICRECHEKVHAK